MGIFVLVLLLITVVWLLGCWVVASFVVG